MTMLHAVQRLGTSLTVLAWGDGIWRLLALAMQFTIAMVAAVATGACLALHPREGRVTFSAEQLDAILPAPPERPVDDGTPRARIEGFRGWVWLAAALMMTTLGHSIVTQGFGTSWTINAYNIFGIMVSSGLGDWIGALFAGWATTTSDPGFFVRGC